MVLFHVAPRERRSSRQGRGTLAPVTELTPTVTHWGAYLVEADGRSVTGVRGHPADPAPSPIGENLTAVRECRVARPSIRRSWLEGGPGTATDRRGREPFVEVEWDRALDLVAAELARVRDVHGHRSVYGGSYGWASAGRFHMANLQLHRFLGLFGGYTGSVGSYSSAAAGSILPHVLGLRYGEAVAQQTSWSVIAEHTDLIVGFGGIRPSNAQVTYGGQGPHHTEEWLDVCRRRGIDVVNLSPLRDDQFEGLDGRWLPLRPGTDVAVMAGLIHTLIVDDLVDLDFLTSHCVGWPRLAAYLRGDADGTPRSNGSRSARRRSGLV